MPNFEKISSFLDQWWKILIILSTIVGLIYEISVLHLTIQENHNKIESLGVYIDEELNLRDSRADKRYTRAMGLAVDLKEELGRQEKELEKHLIEDAYERGLNDMYRKLHK